MSGCLFTLGRGHVNYETKQHTCVAKSTCEAKYYSAADSTKEGLHLRQLMGEIFNEPITGTNTIWEDNQSAIGYSQNALVIEKITHIGMKWHFLKDHVQPRYLPIVQMVANMFTKPLQGHALTRRRSAIMGGEYPIQRFIP
jgi:hypothetical protein